MLFFYVLFNIVFCKLQYLIWKQQQYMKWMLNDYNLYVTWNQVLMSALFQPYPKSQKSSTLDLWMPINGLNLDYTWQMNISVTVSSANSNFKIRILKAHHPKIHAPNHSDNSNTTIYNTIRVAKPKRNKEICEMQTPLWRSFLLSECIVCIFLFRIRIHCLYACCIILVYRLQRENKTQYDVDDKQSFFARTDWVYS